MVRISGKFPFLSFTRRRIWKFKTRIAPKDEILDTISDADSTVRNGEYFHMDVEYASPIANENYTDNEESVDQIVLKGSYIDSSCYPPWSFISECTSYEDNNGYFVLRSKHVDNDCDRDLTVASEKGITFETEVPVLWVDPSGYMELNTKQSAKFTRWIRYSSNVEDVAIFKSAPCSTRIVQGYVGDCSFLASLASLSEYEKTYKVKLLTSVIRVLDAQKTAYILEEHNLSNHYHLTSCKISIGCRLFFNGSPRCILVDDYVPIRDDGQLLCAHSKDKGELWVTLLEKAFVQLQGRSYSVQATNPGVDIYHLTEWIPEIIQLPSYLNSNVSVRSAAKLINTPRNKKVHSKNHGSNIPDTLRWKRVWDDLYSGFITGACVLCLGTSEIWDAVPSGLGYTEGISISSGIVSCHAYSVLRVAEVNCGQYNKVRLLFLKNPWGKIRWTKKYSPMDNSSWNPYLCKELDYYPNTEDDGTFWISWEDVLNWFSHLYVCWNPKLFNCSSTLNLTWKRNEIFMGSLVPEDIYLSVFNPQVRLQVSFDDYNAVTVYLLLLQHRSSVKASFKYLAMHAFKQDAPVVCPSMPHVQGVYSNGECILLKFTLIKEDVIKPPLANEESPNTMGITKDLGQSNSTSSAIIAETCIKCKESEPVMTILLSYYMKKMEEPSVYTLKAYSTGRIKLKENPSAVGYNWSMNICEGEWNKNNSGGNPNNVLQFFNNPHFRLEFERATNAIVVLESELPFSVNLRVFKGRVATVRALKTKQAISSQDYKIHSCAICSHFEAGQYTVIPSTFKQGDLGHFRIVIHSEYSSSIFKIPYPALNEVSSELIGHKFPSYHKYTFKNTDAVDIIVSVPILISIRIRFKKNVEHKIAIFGSSKTASYPKFKGYDSCKISDATSTKGEFFCSSISCACCGGPCGRFFEFDRSEHPKEYSMGYDICVYSDLHGGISKNGKTSSSAAQHILQRKSVVNFTLVELLPSSLPYRLISYGSCRINFISSNDICAIT